MKNRCKKGALDQPLESRTKVDEMVPHTVAAGRTTYTEPQDHGFMYGHGFQDLDGHIWELIYMEPSAVKWELRSVKIDHNRR